LKLVSRITSARCSVLSCFHDIQSLSLSLGWLKLCFECVAWFAEEKKREKKKTKKKVKFADSVKKEGRERTEEKRASNNCRDETSDCTGMPANRVALYNGILRERVHRTECSY